MGSNKPHVLGLEQFSFVVQDARFSSSEHDPALFTHTSDHGSNFLLLYADDMLITRDDQSTCLLLRKSRVSNSRCQIWGL
jgi:hypothetical protein